MNIHEYQAKQLLAKFGAPVAKGVVAFTVEEAVEGAKSLNDDKIAEYLRQNTIPTIMGPIKFGKNGEWTESGMMQVQYKNIKGNDLEQFRGMDTQVVVAPAKKATGEAVLPFEQARQ